MSDLPDLNTVAPATATLAADRRTLDAAVPYDPTQDQEQKRGQIAMLLIWTLVGLSAFVALAAALSAQSCWEYPASCSGVKESVDVLKTLIELVFTPLVGLVGAATGFYFGGKTK